MSMLESGSKGIPWGKHYVGWNWCLILLPLLDMDRLKGNGEAILVIPLPQGCTVP